MIKLYYHNGSTNHGCEAIVRATQKILGRTDIKLYSRKPESDLRYGLNEIVDVQTDIVAELEGFSWRRICAAIYRRVKKNNYMQTILSRNNFFKNVRKGDVYFSIGGDNYCYTGREVLGFYNTGIHKRGAKTVLWGCSFEPTDMTEPLERDIASYDVITARESITYNLLKQYNPNTYLLPDPAFQLEKRLLPLPEGFLENNTVGINISPLITLCESVKGITIANYQNLLAYIIEKTDMNIALIPHVVEKNNDDRTVLQFLFNYFADTGRICMIDDCNCMELKGYISRCRFFIGARTHATIAAYSSCVPTLVVGYSVKARGIAQDIFGTAENYVIPVQELQKESDLLDKFFWLMKREDEITDLLEVKMPEFCAKALESKDLISKLLGA